MPSFHSTAATDILFQRKTQKPTENTTYTNGAAHILSCRETFLFQKLHISQSLLFSQALQSVEHMGGPDLMSTDEMALLTDMKSDM